jgi:uncharacterized repeat protein (TIGR03803 family)
MCHRLPSERPKRGYPNAGLLSSADGTLYGTTPDGGDMNFGTVFALIPAPHFIAPADFSEGKFKAAFSGQSGRTLQILLSTNLIDWHPYTNLFNATGTVQFIDPTANGERRFYRGRVLP